MCDTLVALGNSTKDGSVLFAKNSDRDPNEAHFLQLIPGAKHRTGEQVKCTYIEILQVTQTYTVLLAKPFWIWGAEMGANEYGVVIGNEAVFTKITDRKNEKLIGMDLLRLALERSKNAEQALHILIQLLKEHGQGGNCGLAHKSFYDNSYLIADSKEAWVLETAGEHWAAEKVKDIRSISNAITIESRWDLASENLVNYAVDRGWCKNRSEFNFRKCYSDFLYTTFADSRKRQTCTMDLLRSKKGRITSLDLMGFLRMHQSGNDSAWRVDKPISGMTVCAHTGVGPIRISQTTGSMVSQLSTQESLHWLTATAAPCTSIFKPIWMESGIPVENEQPTATYNEASRWWRHEVLHREILRDYDKRIEILRNQRNRVESANVTMAQKMMKSSTMQKRAFTFKCFEEEDRLTEEWQREIDSMKSSHRNMFYYSAYLKSLNKKAKIEK